jgi:hypothetical protein
MWRLMTVALLCVVALAGAGAPKGPEEPRRPVLVRVLPDAWVQSDGFPVTRQSAWRTVESFRRARGKRGVASADYGMVTSPVDDEWEDQRFVYFVVEGGVTYRRGFAVQKSTGLLFTLWDPMGVDAEGNVPRPLLDRPAPALDYSLR